LAVLICLRSVSLEKKIVAVTSRVYEHTGEHVLAVFAVCGGAQGYVAVCAQGLLAFAVFGGTQDVFLQFANRYYAAVVKTEGVELGCSYTSDQFGWYGGLLLQLIK